MKKYISIIILSIFVTLAGGCANFSSYSKVPPNTNTEASIAPSTNVEASIHTIADYYPFKENVKYIYEGSGSEYAAYTTWTDYSKDNKIQLRINNGGTEVVKVIERISGELKLILSKEETYYREDLTSKAGSSEEVLLKEPLTKGTSWTLADGRKRYISNIDVEVTTPMGKYKALEVTTENKDSKTQDYYALNMGLVKTVFSSNNLEVTSTLSKLEANTQLSQRVRFYYPNVNESKIYYIDKKLSFNTNDITKMILEKNFKELPSEDLGKVLGPNAKIRSLYLGKDNIVYVDFSKEFISEMNAGAGYETMILQSITNTLGNYYGVNKVYLTVEDNLYSSGHIILGKGEFLTTDNNNLVEFKK
jgi:spore germination protein GerM